MVTSLVRSDNKNPVIGDDVTIDVTVTVPAGTTLVKAWITFKSSLRDADNGAILQKTTTSFSGTTIVTFALTLSHEETSQFLPDKTYQWDVQAKDSNGNIATLIPRGEVVWQKGVTDATE